MVIVLKKEVNKNNKGDAGNAILNKLGKTGSDIFLAYNLQIGVSSLWWLYMSVMKRKQSADPEWFAACTENRWIGFAQCI